MQQKLHANLRLAAVAGALVLISGCSTVTPEQLSAVESKVNNALSEARAASSAAQEAKQMASKAAAEAAEAARQAQSTADAAMACCNENKDRIERMFEQTMRK